MSTSLRNLLGAELNPSESLQTSSGGRVTFSYGSPTAVSCMALLAVNTDCICIIGGFRVCGHPVRFRILSSPFWVHWKAEAKQEPFTWTVLSVR